MKKQQFDTHETVERFFDYIRVAENPNSTDAQLEQAQTDAFVSAEQNGWDWDSDMEWSQWALHASATEIAHEGLKRYLKAVK